MVLGGLRSRDHCGGIAQKLIAALSMPIEHRGTLLSVGASAGIAVFPDDAGDADALMRCADAAMYRMKVTSAGGFCYFAEAVPRPPS